MHAFNKLDKSLITNPISKYAFMAYLFLNLKSHSILFTNIAINI